MSKYYSDFWDDYRLQERTREIKNNKQGSDFPDEGVTLIVVAEEETNITHWLDRLGSQVEKVNEIIWVGRESQTLELPENLPEKITILGMPEQPKGQDVNRVIQKAGSSIIVLVNTRIEPLSGWLGNLLFPFVKDREILFSLGQIQPVSPWRSLALHSQMWTTLPFWGLAFRQRAWAQAGGLPADLPLYSAWSLFSFRLKSLQGAWTRSSTASACLRTRAQPMLALKQAFQEGQIGLFGASIHKQFPLSAFIFLSIILGIIFLVFYPVTWPGMIFGVSFFLATLVAGRNAVRESEEGVRIGVGRLLLIGLIRQFHFIGYTAGVLKRRTTRLILEKEHEIRLREIIQQRRDIKGTIVYLPTHDWGFMFQRPQQLARHFARAGYLFFYCTKNEQTDAFIGFQEVELNLYVCAVPLETFAILKRPILLIGSPWYAPMLEWFNKPLVVYDHYDDLEISAARLADHQKLITESALVLTTSQELFQRVRVDRPDTLLIPNAVDYQFVQKMRPHQSAPIPSELEIISRKGQPVIGYTGALANWFDYELVQKLADSHSEWQFVLIGVSYDGSLERSGLLNQSNVSWLGWKPYQELFQYVWNFSVAFIPFIINDITKATSPVKLFEFFACQKPVIATPMPECMRYPEVLIASDHQSFSTKIEQALKQKDNPAICQHLDKIARLNTWASRVQKIDEALLGMI